jgi:DNA anti-recombination protein RmuC
MTDQLEAVRNSVVAAVQQELNRYNQVVSAEIQRLRTEVSAERAARERTEEQLAALANAAQRRQEEVDVRIGRVADEVNVGLAAAVESAAGPIVRQLEHRQDTLETTLTTLDRTVRKFDGQAGQIVEHINAVTEATEARIDEVVAEVAQQTDGRVAGLSARLDELSAQAARQQSEVSNVVGQRVDQAEARINERIQTTEGRIAEETGARIADIDAYVGRVSASLDEAVTMLSDRIAGADARFAEIDASLQAFAARLDSVDIDALDDLKDRFGSVAGEVELIRIETERFQKSIGETMDKTTVRIVELETQVQEQHLDVDTAVQLERLEEVERALIALDPSQFVRRSESEIRAERAASNGNGHYDADPSSNGASADDVAAPASAPFSAPTPFNPPVNAQH